jgi:hypothetical protein
MNVNAFLQKDYENEPPSGPKKTNPNKACPELAEALSAAEGAVEWANFKPVNGCRDNLLDLKV